MGEGSETARGHQSEKMGLVDFMLLYGSMVVKLSTLLNRRFISKEDFDSPIGRALKTVLFYHNSGRYEERDYELARLHMLVKHLEEINIYDKGLLKLFQDKINRDDANYYGFRFEVAVASSLIRRKTYFQKSERPDFKILYNGNEIFIECTSVHLHSSSLPNLRRKIMLAVKEKSRKGYDKPNAALFLDVTNIYYRILLTRQPLYRDDVVRYAQEALGISGFGAAVLFVYVLNKDLNRFELNYLRVDNQAIDPVLKNFLNQHYNYGTHEIHEYALPEKASIPHHHFARI
ncbi:MAG: hypothetical protein QXR97_07195 [Thermoproteota archaeon]